MLALVRVTKHVPGLIQLPKFVISRGIRPEFRMNAFGEAAVRPVNFLLDALPQTAKDGIIVFQFQASPGIIGVTLRGCRARMQSSTAFAARR